MQADGSISKFVHQEFSMRVQDSRRELLHVREQLMKKTN